MKLFIMHLIIKKILLRLTFNAFVNSLSKVFLKLRKLPVTNPITCLILAGVWFSVDVSFGTVYKRRRRKKRRIVNTKINVRNKKSKCKNSRKETNSFWWIESFLYFACQISKPGK